MVVNVGEVARRQWRDYQARDPGTVFAEAGFAIELEQAYAVQDAVAHLRVDAGDRILGWKVGCTGPGTIAQFGMAGPIRGYLYESEMHASGTRLKADCYANLAIEGEMALSLGHGHAIVGAFPIIELHNFVFRTPRKTLSELVANNGLNAGIVVPGPDCQGSRNWLTADAPLAVRVNGVVRGEGRMWPLEDGAAASVGWLRQHLGRRGLAMRAGQFVLAGTALGLYSVQPGDHVVVDLDGVPVTECLIT